MGILLDLSSLGGEAVRVYRQEIGKTQAEFWSKLGVTQSAGSRYERGRQIPKSLIALLRIVHRSLSAKRKQRTQQ